MVDWQGIIGRDGPVVWRTVYRLLGNRADAEDCYQETFLAAVEVWGREPVRSSRALLQRLATTRAMDRLRVRYRRAGREEASPLDFNGTTINTPLPGEAAETEELTQLLREALAELSPKQAEVFCLHCLEDLSYQEIASHLNVTVDSVGVLLHRARSRLKLRLAAFAPGKLNSRL